MVYKHFLTRSGIHGLWCSHRVPVQECLCLTSIQALNKHSAMSGSQIGSAKDLGVAKGGVEAKQSSYVTSLQMSSQSTMAFLPPLSLKTSVAEP